MKVGNFMIDTNSSYKSLVFSKDINQVYYVDDRINVGWKVVVPVNPRSKLVVYRRENELRRE